MRFTSGLVNLGKRELGETLYIPFATYNDSGASIALGAPIAVSSIEVFKNGDATARATDSGYSLISDTGQYGDRVGLNRFSIELFNTSDDTGFYDVGSQYHVAVDSLTVDGRTVRFFPAVFEIGTPKANITQIDGDTGFADLLGKFASLLSTAGQIDTGTVATPLPADVQEIDGDTGAANHLEAAFASGFNDTGINDRLARILADTDTGIQSSVNVTSFSDTGVSARLTAIQNKTDSLTFTQAGVVDANIQYVNDREVEGTGEVNDPWGPA